MGLQQHPIPSLPATPLSAPPGILLSHPPSVHLSSSPASSPRIVGSPPNRTQSIHPERGSFMTGDQPGADFLELTSDDDDSGWEDDNGTRNFSDVEGAETRASAGTLQSTRSEHWEEEERGRKRHNEYLTALPPFNQIPAHDSATEESSPLMRRPPSQARQMSLQRYSKVNVVHNRGSPRSSLLSDASSDVMPQPLRVSRNVSQDLEGEPPNRASSETQRHHQRLTSESESIRMSAFLNAHYATLQGGVDSRPNSPPAPQFTFPDNARHPRSLPERRHIKVVAPIRTQMEPDPNTSADADPDRDADPDPDRPPHLPAHFIKTPYPFSPKKEFPPPKTRPRKTDLYITPMGAPKTTTATTTSDKGIHVLGMAHASAYNPRSRSSRNISAQDPLRNPPSTSASASASHSASPKPKHERWNSTRSTRDSTLYLSLLRHTTASHASASTPSALANRLETLTIPSSCLTGTPQPSPTFKPKLRHHHPPAVEDYDDMHFAQELRGAYARLAGSWVRRAVSARKLRYVRLGRVGAWSGGGCCLSQSISPSSRGGCDGRGSTCTCICTCTDAGTLLAARGGLMSTTATMDGVGTPFTEQALWELYCKPATGDARYTWVHWARRVAASNQRSRCRCRSRSRSRAFSYSYTRIHSRSQSRNPGDENDNDIEDDDDDELPPLPAITTIQFVHAFAPFKILTVLVLMLACAVAAAVLYIFLGSSLWSGAGAAREREEKVTPGVLVGLLVLGVEGVVFLGWVVGSWMWL